MEHVLIVHCPGKIEKKKINASYNIFINVNLISVSRESHNKSDISVKEKPSHSFPKNKFICSYKVGL